MSVYATILPLIFLGLLGNAYMYRFQICTFLFQILTYQRFKGQLLCNFFGEKRSRRERKRVLIILEKNPDWSVLNISGRNVYRILKSLCNLYIFKFSLHLLNKRNINYSIHINDNKIIRVSHDKLKAS